MFLGIRFNWLNILVIFVSFCCATAARAAATMENEDYGGPVISHQEISSMPAWAQIETLEDIRENQLMQLWGKILLGLGFGHALLGIALIEIDPWGTLGQVGFSVIGGGVGLLTTGMFCLGFSRPVHLKQISRQKSSIPMNGMTLSYTRRF
jgi:hypothetical protein